VLSESESDWRGTGRLHATRNRVPLDQLLPHLTWLLSEVVKADVPKETALIYVERAYG
jgi:hypothetical protein